MANTTFALDLHGGGKSGANVAFTYSFGPELLTFALCKYGATPFFHPVLLPYTQTTSYSINAPVTAKYRI